MTPDPHPHAGGGGRCVSCGGYLPEEIEDDTGVYCPNCGTGQLVTDGGQRPTGGLVEIMRSYDRQITAAQRHATAEGHPVEPLTVLESYDRVLHPWIHGRRPHDIGRKARCYWESLRLTHRAKIGDAR